MRSLAWFLLLTCSSCFSPNYDGIVYKCSLEKPGCPTEHQCVDGLCLPIPDGGAADAGADLAEPGGCRSGAGTKLGARAWACPGAFATGQASARCADGWAPCTAGAAVDLVACNQLPGFFVAERPGYFAMTPDTSVCTAINSGTGVYRVFYGCGASGPEALPCEGFLRVQDCKGAWNCGEVNTTPHTLASVSYAGSPATSGVLCCR